MLITVSNFLPQKMQTLRAFSSIFMSLNMISHLRKYVKSADSKCKGSLLLTPRRTSIGLTSGAPIDAGFPARRSGHDPGAVIGAWGARRPWNFMKVASGNV